MLGLPLFSLSCPNVNLIYLPYTYTHTSGHLYVALSRWSLAQWPGPPLSTCLLVAVYGHRTLSLPLWCVTRTLGRNSTVILSCSVGWSSSKRYNWLILFTNNYDHTCERLAPMTTDNYLNSYLINNLVHHQWPWHSQWVYFISQFVQPIWQQIEAIQHLYEMTKMWVHSTGESVGYVLLNEMFENTNAFTKGETSS